MRYWDDRHRLLTRPTGNIYCAIYFKHFWTTCIPQRATYTPRGNIYCAIYFKHFPAHADCTHQQTAYINGQHILLRATYTSTGNIYFNRQHTLHHHNRTLSSPSGLWQRYYLPSRHNLDIFRHARVSSTYPCMSVGK